MFFIELYTLHRAWNGLSDEELLWEPMPGCWTVRPVEKVQTATPFVVGTWAADFDADLVMAAIEGKAVEPLTWIRGCSGTSGRNRGTQHSWTSLAVSTPPTADGPRRTSHLIRSSQPPTRRSGP